MGHIRILEYPIHDRWFEIPVGRDVVLVVLESLPAKIDDRNRTVEAPDRDCAESQAQQRGFACTRQTFSNTTAPIPAPAVDPPDTIALH